MEGQSHRTATSFREGRVRGAGVTYLDSSLFAGSAAVARLCVGASSGHFAINHQSSIINHQSIINGYGYGYGYGYGGEREQRHIILFYSILFL